MVVEIDIRGQIELIASNSEDDDVHIYFPLDINLI